MKKIIVGSTILFMVLLSETLIAQNFSGGIRLGLTGSEVSGDRLAGPNKAGFTASAYTSLFLTEDAGIQLEISYIQKGSRSTPSEKNNYYSYKFKLDYVEMPILFKYELKELNVDIVRKLGLELGLGFSYLVRSYEEEDGRECEPGENPAFNKFETGIIAGMYYPLSSSLYFGFRFSNSLTPIRPHAFNSSVWYNKGQYHTVWSFSLYYNII